MAIYQSNIPIEEIDRQDQTFLLRLPSDLDRLAASLQCQGQINPLRLEQTESGLRPVCGFRRLEAAGPAGLSSLNAYIHTDSDPVQLFTIALEDNLLARGLSRMEKAEAIGKLRNEFGLSDETLIGTFLPVLDVPADRHHLVELLELSGLAEPLKDAVEAGLHFRVALPLGDWSRSEQPLFLEKFEEYGPGQGQQKKLFSLLDDLRRTTDQTVSELWEAIENEDLAGRANLPPHSRLQQILSALHHRRYPTLARFESRYQRLQRELAIPPEIRVQPPEYFEGEQLSVSFRASSVQDFRQTVDRLVEISRHPALEEVYELL